MRLALVLCLAIGCGGKKGDEAPTVRSGDAADKLWALAPAGTVGAWVVTPYGVAQLGSAFERVKTILADPELAAVARPFTAVVTQVLGSPTGKLGDIGIDPTKGFAIFGLDKGAVAVLPIGDRAKFVASQQGSTADGVDTIHGLVCKQAPAGYACATKLEQISLLGGGRLRRSDAGARGDLEGYLAASLLGAGIQEADIAITLDDGRLDAHAFLEGSFAPLSSLVAARSIAPDPSGGGFIVGNLAPLLALERAAGPTAKLLQQFRGPFEATMSASALAFLARIPLIDPAPVQEVIDHCDQLGGMVGLPMLPRDHVCHIDIPGALIPLGVDVWIEDGELRVAQQKGPLVSSASVPRTPLGQDLSTASYPFALWGRGTLFATHLSQALQAVETSKLPELPTMLRLVAQLSELGLGARVQPEGVHLRLYARTIWSNEASVAEGLAAISARDILSGKGDEAAAKLASAHPDSAFARDLAAGPGGMMMPVSIVGILGAVAVPAFMDYMKRGKVSEAQLQLNKLAKNAKVYYVTNAAFPRGDAPLTPPTSCCTGPKGHCVSSDWSAQAWRELDFQIDEPALFQYSYTSDGSTFLATAVGDLDCDGIAITYKLEGSAPSGNPSVKLSVPDPGAD